MENNIRNKVDQTLEKTSEEQFVSTHNITDKEVIRRLNGLKPKFEDLLKREISNDELIDMLNSCMNGNEMQIWFLENSFKNIETTEEQDLAKYFEITTDERILIDLRCFLNCDEANLEDVTNSFLRGRKKDDQ